MIPDNNTKIIFSIIPNGSYASANEVYQVKTEGNRVILRNENTGSGTADAKWSYQCAIWEYTQQ